MTSRRSLLGGAVTLASAAFAPARDVQAGERDGFLDLERTPDYAAAYTPSGALSLARNGARWSAPGISIKTEATSAGVPVLISADDVEPIRVHLRWRAQVPGDLLVLGDAWERSYGDLEWRSLVPDRVMPWYFLTYEGSRLHGYGVETQAAALCFWQVDAQGVSLWLDVSNGGSGVQLRGRELKAAIIKIRRGSKHEEPVAAATSFCRALSPQPRLSPSPLYGSNDWYYAYGHNSAAQTLRDAELVASLSEGNRVRPFSVIDMGWQDGSKTFPSMPELAAQIKAISVRPGLWIRPLEASPEDSSQLLLPSARFGGQAERAKELAFDPTIPEALQLIRKKFETPAGWGYELIKHDFSTYDLLGKWGREMGAQPSSPGWHFHDRSRTNAEIILDFYRAVRSAAGDKTLLVGCNTVGHLGAGIFEAQRTGDDTSGRQWERTRRMGVNTLAFRLPQHNTFFAVDPDCVGITPAVPWHLNREWLQLIADAGVALFISPDPAAVGGEQRAAIRDAFSAVAHNRSAAVPQEWTGSVTPRSWLVTQNGTAGAVKTYEWEDASGCWPFNV